MLVVVVGVLSLAVNAQGPFQGGAPLGQARPARASHPGAQPSPPGRAPRRPTRDRAERSRERPPAPPPAAPARGPQQQAEPDIPVGDLKPLNTQAQALVMSVVDERTLGPVTRSRPTDGEPFEVTTRVAFPPPEERARIKVGKTIGVRYDSEDHRRVVVDPEQ